MNKLLPQQFDGNEWFLIISLCIVITFSLLLPRRFPTIVTLVFLALGMGISMFVDFILAPPPNDIYDVNDSGDYYEFFEILFYYLYSPFAYIFVYFFDKWKIRGLFISLYVLVWSLIGVGFEAIAVFFHVFKYKEWNLGFSFVFYLFIQSFEIFLYYRIKEKYQQNKREDGYEWV